ncbi:Protein F45F2.9 b [Aphelenchoides avenae]|nr:Protein F45F2.9 b [Aphelenchus avenae]
MTSDDFKIFDLLQALDNLKHLKRTGWVHNKVPEPETVASHMYRMSVLAMTLAPKLSGIDVNRCVKMALVHDLGEAIVGDITPHCGVADQTKFDLEHEAMKKIAGFVPSVVGDEWVSLWREYEEATTPEAIAVKQLDKLDMVAQALHYEEKYGLDLTQFFTSTQGIFKTEPFLSWDAQIRERRQRTRQQEDSN